MTKRKKPKKSKKPKKGDMKPTDKINPRNDPRKVPVVC